MFPLAIIGIAIVGYMIGKGKSPLSITSHERPPTHVGRRLPHPPHPPSRPLKPSAIDMLKSVIRHRRRPNAWLVSEAVREAYENGDVRLADAILEAFDQSILKIDPNAEIPSEVPASPPIAPDAPASASDAPPAPEPQSYSSPIEGVADDDWSLFANAMKIHTPDFETDRHIGAFHQRKDRLTQLQLQAGKDEDQQYHAFVADCLDHLRNKSLINEHVASTVSIKGDEHVVTASGMLCLMKAAGPKNAVHWIQHPEERDRFPRTTEIFLRCNNCF